MTDPAGSLAGLHVLLVDHDVRMRDMLTIVLEQAGARVTACANGAEVLDALRSAVPDVLVMDIKLPGPDGFSIVRTIRHLDDPWARAVAAVALTGYGEQFEVEQIVEAGFSECLNKPVSVDLLVRTVARLAGRVT
jgi:two-component system CheB/CheR fusion protein